MRKIAVVWLLLAMVGWAGPYSFFIPWVTENGLDIPRLIQELFVNRISSFFGIDVILSAVCLFVFIGIEHRKQKIKFVWLSIIGTLLIGVSFGFPLFLFLKEMQNGRYELAKVSS